MSISSVAQNYYSQYFSNAQSSEFTGMSSNKTNEQTNNDKTSGTNPYGSDYLSDLAAALAMTMDGLGLGSNDRVTFNTMMQYCEQLAKEFDEKVQADLKELGIEDAQFQLVTNKDGTVDVISEHEDKAMIEQYFKDNPEMVDKFKQIEALTNLEEARKEQNYDPNTIRSRIQMESMTTWFTNTGQGVNSIMNFNGAETSLLAGLNKTV